MASGRRFITRWQSMKRKVFLKMYPDFDTRYWHYFFLSGRLRVGHLRVRYRSDKNEITRISKDENDMDPRWRRFLYKEGSRKLGKVRDMFYEMYPDSDPKYWPYLKFVTHTRNEKLVSIDVYYTHEGGTVHIIKGNNDKDTRWRKVFHSSPPSSSKDQKKPSRDLLRSNDRRSRFDRESKTRWRSERDRSARKPTIEEKTSLGVSQPPQASLTEKKEDPDDVVVAAREPRNLAPTESRSLEGGKKRPSVVTFSSLPEVALNGEDIAVLAIIGGTSAYILWNYIIKSRRWKRKLTRIDEVILDREEK